MGLDLDETNFCIGSTGCFEVIMGRYKRYEMGDYIFCRLFCVWEKYLHSLCPMVMITGLPCPGCGLTRALFCLLRLDFSGAFRMHPFIYPIAFYAGIFGWNRYIRKQNMGSLLKALVLLSAVAMILFYIWRMLKFFPGDPPMSYYSRNLLRCVGIAGRRFFVDILHFPW